MCVKELVFLPFSTKSFRACLMTQCTEKVDTLLICQLFKLLKIMFAIYFLLFVQTDYLSLQT